MVDMKQQQKTTRADKALEIVQSGGVVRIHDDCYYVKSQNPKNNREYEVIPSMNVCNCEDFLRNGVPCKHCIAVQIHRTNQIQAVLLEALSKLGKVVKVKLVGVAAK
jgi:predicted nucleic acid-binding Zn finger protein